MIDLVFLVDSSGSICSGEASYPDPHNPGTEICSNWDTVRAYMVQFVEQIGATGGDGTRVGLATFDSDARYEFGLDT